MNRLSQSNGAPGKRSFHERVGRVTLFLAPAMPTSMFNRAIAFDGAQPFDEAELDVPRADGRVVDV